MKKYILTIAIIAACYVSSGQTNETLNFADASTGGAEAIATAFREQRSGVQVAGEGVVVRILPDDSDGPRHQRFILSLASGQTLLVAHNIDIAPRLTSLKSGDLVAFNGVYEWNAKGGTVHWTHRDPSGRHPGGVAQAQWPNLPVEGVVPFNNTMERTAPKDHGPRRRAQEMMRATPTIASRPAAQLGR